MRGALGLTPPERKIGQTAHDFVMAMGHERVDLEPRASNATARRPLFPDFVQRLAAVAGKDFGACRERGNFFVELARAIDRPAAAPGASKRPMPRPPIELRPRRLSVTRIETLRRDPYAIYAEFILGLAEMPQPMEAQDRRILGSAIHDVLASFTARFAAGPLPSEAPSILAAMMQTKFKDELADPDFAAFQWPRIERAMRFYLDFEMRRRAASRGSTSRSKTTSRSSSRRRHALHSVRHSRPDRASCRRQATLIDYKTGTPPSVKEVRAGFAPQLTLEAAMARRGAFGLPPEHARRRGDSMSSSSARTAALNGRCVFKKGPRKAVAEVAEKHFAELVALLNQFRDPDDGLSAAALPEIRGALQRLRPSRARQGMVEQRARGGT